MDEDQQQPQAPVSAEQVYATLQSTLSLTTATRGAAEAQLRAWEKDAAPGFISSLVKVISEVNGVPEVRIPGGMEGVVCGAGFSARTTSWTGSLLL